jgi:hypothetical protein
MGKVGAVIAEGFPWFSVFATRKPSTAAANAEPAPFAWLNPVTGVFSLFFKPLIFNSTQLSATIAVLRGQK